MLYASIMSELSHATRYYLLVFGVLTIAGGLIGFVRAKSKPSLIAGAIAGGLLLTAGWMMVSFGRPAVILGLVVSLALASRFSRAFAKSKKVMPAGLMAGLGIVGVVLTALTLLA